MMNSKQELTQLEVKLMQLEHEQAEKEKVAKKLAERNKAQADLLLRTIKMQLSRTC